MLIDWKGKTVKIPITKSEETNMYPASIEDFIKEKINSDYSLRKYEMSFWVSYIQENTRPFPTLYSNQNYKRYLKQLQNNYPEAFI